MILKLNDTDLNKLDELFNTDECNKVFADFVLDYIDNLCHWIYVDYFFNYKL